MTISIAKCVILAILFVAMRQAVLIQAQPSLPCYFVFGDALFDNGNNNNLFSLAKSNYLPYGYDFFYGPRGRFTNGATVADFIVHNRTLGLSTLNLVLSGPDTARSSVCRDRNVNPNSWRVTFNSYFGQRMGYSVAPPPYATAGGSNAVRRGLTYASGAAGILDETAYQIGDRIWMDRQLSNHQSTVNLINTQLGNQTAANNLLNRCLYLVSMGNNDYLFNYYFKLPLTLSALADTPETFAQKLITKYTQQLTTLYSLGARKVAVFGVFPLGCLPNTIAQFKSNGTCVEKVNNGVQIFNNKLVQLIRDLNLDLDDAQFTYINTFTFATSDLSSIGVRVSNVACCEVSPLTLGLCVPNGNVCNNRDEYAYFDNYNPTQVLANYTASRAYFKEYVTDAHPYDIVYLVES